MTSIASSFPTFLRRAQNWADKTRWGCRIVGLGPTLLGLARLTQLYLRRPKKSELKLRSGQILEFGFPSQVPNALLMFGEFIDPEFAFLSRVRRPDWVVADVGAAIGQFTLFAATLPVSFVHSFEPSAANAAALSRNIRRNGVDDKVAVHKTAFSNAESEAYFETTPNTWVSGLSDTGTELVSVRTLDAEFERLELDHVSVLKINVAGFEPQVLEGAETFLTKGGADILVLLLSLASLPWYARLASHGYRFFYFHPGENALYEVASFDAAAVLGHRPWPARNIIAIHRSAIEKYLAAPISIRKLGDNSTVG